MCQFAFIRKEYFEVHDSFVEMMDPNNRVKQTERQYLFVKVKYKDNNILVPLRKELPNLKAKMCFKAPCQSKPNAGLDYRKIMIVNDMTDIELVPEQKLPDAQYNKIVDNYDKIEKAVISYIEGYIRSAKKNRHLIDYEYKYSTLHNYHNELHITE